MPTLRPYDIVLLELPGDEPDAAPRKRPALVFTAFQIIRRTGMATVAPIVRGDAPEWPGDVPIKDHAEAGLPLPCKVRMKLMTIDVNSARCIGHLETLDRVAVAKSLREVIAL
jgi:mRNA-degrading endonuclease toxin of MazEF toxin-antitoxin module